ncbi:unnamed protein product [Closterium sp. NIES-53]
MGPSFTSTNVPLCCPLRAPGVRRFSARRAPRTHVDFQPVACPGRASISCPLRAPGARRFLARQAACCRPCNSYTAPPPPLLLHPPAARVAVGEGMGVAGVSSKEPITSSSLSLLPLLLCWEKWGGAWRCEGVAREILPSQQPPLFLSLSHGRACHCGGEGEAVAEASKASAATARCYRGTSNCRPCLHLLSLLLSTAIERQVLPLSHAVPPHAAAASTCSPCDLLPHAPYSFACFYLG